MNHITDSGTIRAFEGDYPDEMDWVSLDWLIEKIKHLHFGEEVDSNYWGACMDILILLYNEREG